MFNIAKTYLWTEFWIHTNSKYKHKAIYFCILSISWVSFLLLWSLFCSFLHLYHFLSSTVKGWRGTWQQTEALEAEHTGEGKLTEPLQMPPDIQVFVRHVHSCSFSPPVKAHDSPRKLNFNIRKEKELAKSQGWSIYSIVKTRTKLSSVPPLQDKWYFAWAGVSWWWLPIRNHALICAGFKKTYFTHASLSPPKLENSFSPS